MATLKYWIWLTTRRPLDAAMTAKLLEYFGSPEQVYFADPAEYELAGMRGDCRAALLDKSLDGAERILADCDRIQAEVLTRQDARYPERLRQIDAPPCVLYVRGRLPAIDESVVIGVVGSRNPTPYGVDMAGRLGLGLAQAGAVVVSGIAQGIDSAALRGALQGGGTPVSVLGCGVDVVYPSENRRLYADMMAAGALVSEYPPGTEPRGAHFPVRNRIISGMSLGVTAVEAGVKSGTLITARLALDQNRDVFAFPGPANGPMSVGTNRLIQRGEAKLVTCAQDVLEEYARVYPGWLQRPGELPGEGLPQDPPVRPRRPEKQAPAPVEQPPAPLTISMEECRARFTDDERDILLALESGPLLCDELVDLTQIPARRVLSALTLLQVQGAVTEETGKRFAAALLIRRP